MKTTHIFIIALIIIVTPLIGQMVLTSQNISSFSISKNNSSEKWIDVNIPVKPEIIGILFNFNILKIHAIEPSVPAYLPIIKGTLREGDTLFIDNDSVITPKKSVISEEDAPLVAHQAMLQYGGFPHDAVMIYSYTSYLKKFNGSTGEMIEKWPTDTSVSYTRNIDGMPVVGQSDKIIVSLGKDGNILRIYKVWRSLEYSGNFTHIISPYSAIEKIRNNEIINPPASNGIVIENITLGYYEKSREEPELILEPVWIFSGKTPSNDPISFFVYAEDNE
jgi:regulatory protein YycI of two-component signal transduction system YycFG